MKLSLSVRIAENATKDGLSTTLDHLISLAQESSYEAICIRPSVLTTRTSLEQRSEMHAAISAAGLAVSMATTDLHVPLNDDEGPQSLRDILPHLLAAQALGTDLIRICMKKQHDIPWARKAADVAATLNMRIAHQCHTDSLFERVDDIVQLVREIDRPNFGIIYEPANLLLCGQDYGPNAIEQLSPFIMNVYVQNHRLNDEGAEVLPTNCRGDVRFDLIPLWEESGVDYASMFQGLSAVGYDGYVTVHQAYGSMMSPDEAATRSADFLRSCGDFGSRD